jgi:hypothetical protein
MCDWSALQNEGEDDLKKRQLMELAILNGTYRDTKSGGGGATSTGGSQSPNALALAAAASGQASRKSLHRDLVSFCCWLPCRCLLMLVISQCASVVADHPQMQQQYFTTNHVDNHGFSLIFTNQLFFPSLPISP